MAVFFWDFLDLLRAYTGTKMKGLFEYELERNMLLMIRDFSRSRKAVENKQYMNLENG